MTELASLTSTFRAGANEVVATAPATSGVFAPTTVSPSAVTLEE